MAAATVAAAAALGSTLAAPASATQIGGAGFPFADCSANFTFLQGTSPADIYAMPNPGVLTSWSFRTGTAPPPAPRVALKVGRPLGGNDFMIVGQSEVMPTVSDQLNTFPTRIPVAQGDVLGLYMATAGHCVRVLADGYVAHAALGDLQPGTSATFMPGDRRQLTVEAELEPDCDEDGFGDLTQDPDTGACIGTVITKAPPDRTRKRKVKYRFAGSLGTSTFECSFDGKAFKQCTSPKRYKRLKKGKHTFAVRARNELGIVDPTPATDQFKVIG